MRDALNAEIALGTVANVAEGVRWLGNTYLFVRMRKNPMQYGEDHFKETNSRLTQRKESHKKCWSTSPNWAVSEQS